MNLIDLNNLSVIIKSDNISRSKKYNLYLEMSVPSIENRELTNTLSCKASSLTWWKLSKWDLKQFLVLYAPHSLHRWANLYVSHFSSFVLLECVAILNQADHVKSSSTGSRRFFNVISCTSCRLRICFVSSDANCSVLQILQR